MYCSHTRAARRFPDDFFPNFLSKSKRSCRDSKGFWGSSTRMSSGSPWKFSRCLLRTMIAASIRFRACLMNSTVQLISAADLVGKIYRLKGVSHSGGHSGVLQLTERYNQRHHSLRQHFCQLYPISTY